VDVKSSLSHGGRTRLILRCGGRRLAFAACGLELADVVAEEVVHGDELVEIAVRVEQKLREAR